MKTFRLAFPLLIIVILALIVINVSAQPEIPEGVQVFYLETEGLTCVLWPDGSGDCYCPCDPVCPEPGETPTPRGSPTPRGTPPPPSTPTPSGTPDPEPTPEPTKTPKPKCNRGLGNLSENCDPGRSGGKPGAAGEDNEPYGPRGR